MQEQARVPAIRFAGFTDAWEQCKLSELSERTYGGGTPATSKEVFWDGEIPWIQSSDIPDGKLFGVEPKKYISQDGLNNSAAQLVPKDSIAIITRVGVGKLAFMPFSYTTSQDFLSLSRLNTEPFFTIYACYKKLQSELNAVQGTSIKGITKDELLAKVIKVPSYAEQQQIGTFFRHLDHLITLHQRKYSRLCNVKKSMLEKMFPKDGASMPEIRFAGFTDAWEQRKLKEVTALLTGFPFESKEFTNSGIKLVRGMNVKRGYLDFSENLCEYWDSSKGLENYLLEGGDILIQMDGALIGKSYAKIAKNQLPALLVQRVTRARVLTDKADEAFIYQEIQKRFLPYIKRTKTETAVPHLSLSNIADFSIMIPSIDEQKQIGDFFENLDHLITLHQRELERLQNIKKACREKMFV